MDSTALRLLLTQPEGPTLDFKSAWYSLDAPEPGGRYQRDELVRDVLALANGSTSLAGSDARLIIGAGDVVDERGERELFDAIDFPVEGVAARITQLVNSACSPAIGDIDFECIHVNGKRLGVVTVHGSPQLHETTRKLEPKGRITSEHAVFIRSSETTKIASHLERETILRLKRRRFSELRKVSPAAFGAALGALLGAPAGIMAVSADSRLGRLVGMFVGAALFSLSGLTLGLVTQRSLWIKHDWHALPLPARLGLVAALAAAALWVAFNLYAQVMR